MANISWEQIYAPPRAQTEAETPDDRHPLVVALGSWEAWLTFGMLLLVQFPVVASLESANWVNEMPSLLAASMIGLVAGWLLAHLPWRAAVVSAVGLAAALVTTVALVMHTMVIADPLLEDTLTTRWTELWLRLRDWGIALVEGGISSDPLPFVVLLVLAVWGVAYLSAWAVVRWKNAWAALIPAGFVLLTNVSYLPGQPSVHFIIFLFGAILLVTRLHFLRALGRWRREGVFQPEYMSFEVLMTGAWVALLLIVFAWAIPTANNWGPVSDTWMRVMEPVNDRVDRIGRLFVGIGSKKGLPVHSFGEVLPLQGQITLRTEPLMEVDAPEPGNLRGAVYDEYTGAGWRASGWQAVPLAGTTVGAAEFGTPETRAQVRNPVAIEVQVLGEVPDQRLLSFGEPLAADVEAELLVGAAPGDVVGLEPQSRVQGGDTYSTVGTVSAATIETLRSSPPIYPAPLAERYTQLPDTLPPRVGELALQIAGDAEHPYDAARRVEQYLRDEHPYSLEVDSPPPRRDVVDWFLFDSQSGYFDHHASAMVVLMRSLGVPARLGAGFALDERDYDSETKRYTLTEERAWAWPEVYFAGLGWVEFNPTPSRALVTRPGDDSEFFNDPGPSNPAFGLDAALEELLFEELMLEEGEIGPAAGPRAQIDTGPGIGTWVMRVVTVLVAVAFVLLVLGFAIRMAWEHQFRGLAPPARRWAKLQRLSAWAGIWPAATRTPIEATSELTAATGEPRALSALGRSYTRARYGQPGREEPEAEADELDGHYRRVRNRLWRLVARRLLPGRDSRLARDARAAGGRAK